MQEKIERKQLLNPNSRTQVLRHAESSRNEGTGEPESLQNAVNWIEQDSADKTEEYLESCNTRQSGE